jgi:hypothetical protein
MLILSTLLAREEFGETIMAIHGMVLSVVLILNYADGGQTIEQFQHQFRGPTAIEYCHNAQEQLKIANAGQDIMVVHSSCIKY